ncbi:hypothetical protein HBH61_226730 [Parastagonospora nodorum]|nr:hypothetical protein HBH61_226730 [Parastagonospora nodorum]
MTQNVRVPIPQNSYSPRIIKRTLTRLLTGAPSYPKASARLVTLLSYLIGRTTS